jgi:hypothetical protein
LFVYVPYFQKYYHSPIQNANRCIVFIKTNLLINHENNNKYPYEPITQAIFGIAKGENIPFHKRFYLLHFQNTLDTAFDAGGKVSVGLTATTIVSQWTWAATLLYSCVVASKVKHF